jgi:transcription elongation factor Elf1
MCLNFLEDIFYFTKRYETVEKFYIELLKNKNKNVNLNEMKAKYEIIEHREQSPEKVTPRKKRSIQSPKAPPVIPTSSLSVSSEFPEITEIATPGKNFKLPTQRTPRKSHPQTSPSSSPKTSQPKILNPTILPKIENKVRLEILTCDLCSHTTSTKTSLEKHMQIHIKNKELFECQICHKKFATKPVLMNHELTHKLGADRKTFQCKECGKHLSSQTAVRTHMKWHHEEREFKCHVCAKEFATVNF